MEFLLLIVVVAVIAAIKSGMGGDSSESSDGGSHFGAPDIPVSHDTTPPPSTFDHYSPPPD